MNKYKINAINWNKIRIKSLNIYILLSCKSCRIFRDKNGTLGYSRKDSLIHLSRYANC